MLSDPKIETLKQITTDSTSIKSTTDLIFDKINYFVDHPILLLILAIITVYDFLKKNKSTKGLSYMVRNFNLIKDDLKKVEDLEMFYKGMKVSNLTVSKIAIWNSGTQTIDIKDIPETDTLRITVSGNAEIFSCEKTCIVKTANAISSPIVDFNTIDLDFRYMDSRHGVILQIIHSGDNKAKIDLVGSIMGEGYIKEINGYDDFAKLSDRIETHSLSHIFFVWILDNILLILTGIFMCLMYIFSAYIDSNWWFLLGLLIFGNLLHLYVRYKHRSNRLPKEFYVFFDS